MLSITEQLLHCLFQLYCALAVVLFCVVFFFMWLYYIHKSLFNLCVVSRPYGIDLHCHRRETLTAFSSSGHMACVGVCFVFCWWWLRRVAIDSHSSSLACVFQGVVYSKECCVCVCTYMHTVWYVCTRFFFSQKNARGDQIICVCVCVHVCFTQEECQLLSRAQWRRRGFCWPFATVQLAATWRLTTPPTTSWPLSKNR